MNQFTSGESHALSLLILSSKFICKLALVHCWQMFCKGKFNLWEQPVNLGEAHTKIHADSSHLGGSHAHNSGGWAIVKHSQEFSQLCPPGWHEPKPSLLPPTVCSNSKPESGARSRTEIQAIPKHLSQQLNHYAPNMSNLICGTKVFEMVPLSLQSRLVPLSMSQAFSRYDILGKTPAFTLYKNQL